MWWKLKKVTDNDERIVYSYSWESDLLDGEIEFDKNTRAITCTKLSQGDTQKGVEWFSRHVWRIIVEEGAPDYKMIAIG